MVPNITKGGGLSGALRYVLGQGRGRGNDWQVYGRGWITIYRQGKPYKYQGGQPFKMA